MARNSSKRRRTLLLETMEERILCSATAPEVDSADSQKDHPPPVAADISISEARPALAPDAENAAAVAEQPAAAQRRELIFVDTGVEDYQWFVDDVLAHKAPGAEIEVVLLDTERDGIVQISEVLAGRSDLDAIHFVTHGTDRAVKLGATWIDGDAFSANRDAIAAWGATLKAGPIYSSTVAISRRSAAGRDLLTAFSDATRTGPCGQR